MKPTFVNLTPHTIVLLLPSGRRVSFPPSGTVARAVTPDVQVDALEVENEQVEVVVAPPFAEVAGLPDPQPGQYYIVSSIAAEAVRGRPDILIPGTDPDDDPVRDEKGWIVAVRRFRRLTQGGGGYGT